MFPDVDSKDLGKANSLTESFIQTLKDDSKSTTKERLARIAKLEKEREKVYVKPLKVNALFYYMPYFIGIPQAILNFTVFTTVILITKHPLLGFDTFS